MLQRDLPLLALYPISHYGLNRHLLILTLKAPELQNYSAALKVVQQTLGCVEGGKVNSMIQQRVDVVPHGRSVERPAAVKQPKTDGVRITRTGEIMIIITNPTCLIYRIHL